jgi:hypothetical protein
VGRCAHHGPVARWVGRLGLPVIPSLVGMMGCAVLRSAVSIKWDDHAGPGRGS